MKVPTAMALVNYPKGKVSALIQRSGNGFVVKYKEELFFGATIIKCFEQTNFDADIKEMANGFKKWINNQNPEKVSYSDETILRHGDRFIAPADQIVVSRKTPSIYTPRFEEYCLKYLEGGNPATYMEQFVKE